MIRKANTYEEQFLNSMITVWNYMLGLTQVGFHSHNFNK